MEKIPVIKSKLIMPLIPDNIIISDRILKLCNKMHSSRASFIQAPAGSGKTSLLLAAYKNYDQKFKKVLWYRMENEDKNPHSFFSHLAYSLFPENEKSRRCILKTLDSIKDISSQYSIINATILNEIYSCYEEYKDTNYIIVIDDFHFAIESDEISEFIKYLIANMPDNFSLWLSSRIRTKLNSGKLMLDYNIIEITGLDLAFTCDDIECYMEKNHITLSNNNIIDKILIASEGWALGIVMSFKALSKSSPLMMEQMIDKISDSPLLFEYFAAEVIKSINTDLARFLCKVIILSDFTLEDASTILEIDNIKELMDIVEDLGLYVQRIEGAYTTYKFHSLFRKALEKLQKEHLKPEETNKYHIRAAEYYQNKKVYYRAIEHYILANSMDKAIELLSHEGVKLLDGGQLEEVRILLGYFPSEVIDSKPMLVFLKGYIMQNNKPEAAIYYLSKASEMFSKIGNTNMQCRSLIVIATLYSLKNDIENVKKYSSRVPVVSALIKDSWARGVLNVSALCQAAWNDKLQRGVFLSTTAKAFNLDPDWKWAHLAYSCMINYRLGELKIAQNFIEEALKLPLIKQSDNWKGLALTLYHTVLYLQNDEKLAPKVREELIALGEKYDSDYFLAYGKRASAFLKFFHHDRAEAFETLDSSQYYFRKLGNTALINLTTLDRCLWQCPVEESSGIYETAKEAYSLIALEAPGQGLLETAQSVYGAVLREIEYYDEAEIILLSSAKISKSKKAKQVLCGTYMHLAKLYFTTDRLDLGKEYLSKAVYIGKTNNYNMFWDMHFPTLIYLGVLSIVYNIDPNYLPALIERYFGNAAVKYLTQNAKKLQKNKIEAFSTAFIEKFKNISTDSIKIHINMLGSFSISVNDNDIPEQAWKTRKIQGVIKYLLLNRGKTISREQLIDVFWPNSDKKAGLASLRVALSELRKLTMNYGISPESQHPLFCETVKGLEVRVNNEITTDLDSFLKLSRDINAVGSYNESERIDMLEKTISLYKGELLAEDIYDDWIALDREKLRDIYIQSALKLSGYYMKTELNTKVEELLNQVLEQDPYNERAIYMLIKSYTSNDNKNKAVALYSEYVKRLKYDLGLQPSEKIINLVKC